MKVILIDDESISLDVMESALSVFEDVEVVGRYTRPMVAYKDIGDTRPDVAFIDIEMGAINGLEIAELLIGRISNIEVVFVTAYSQYAIDAFEMNAVDYLLKPIAGKRLEKTIGRLRENIKRNETQNAISTDTVKWLNIRCFGEFQVFSFDGKPIRWRTKKAKELFAYLWLNSGQTVHRDIIIGDIYRDKTLDQSITHLHTTVYQLRKAMKDLGYTDSIHYFNGGYKLNVPYDSDLDMLNKLLDNETLTESAMEKILEISKGDFMSEGYSWVLDTQQTYRDSVFMALRKYITSQLKNDKPTQMTKNCLDQMYIIDPYNEETANLFIRYYGSQNMKQDLDYFYRSYVTNLKNDMDIGPSKDTEKLYRKYEYSNIV